MERMRRIRADISKADSAERFAKYGGVDVYLGHAHFIDTNQVLVNGKVLQFVRACIASGARPFVPEYPGVGEIRYHTSDSIFNLQVQPKRLLVVGSGPIGCELGQGFARLGTEVVMFERGGSFLPKDDQDSAAYLKKQMEQDGVQILMHTQIRQFSKSGLDGEPIKVRYQTGTSISEDESTFDAVLFATGRQPNVENMGLEKARVNYDRSGIIVNNNLRTSNNRIFSCGDCIQGPKFTHNSDVQARMVLRNAFFFGSGRKDKIILPYCTYTDPEVASVGMNEQALRAANIQYDVYAKGFDHNDRALCESARGLYKVYTVRGKDEILGATLVGGPAGDLISIITVAMFNKIGLRQLAACVYPYPTYAEIFKQLGDAFGRTILTPNTKGLLKKLVKMTI